MQTHHGAYIQWQLLVMQRAYEYGRVCILHVIGHNC